MSIIALLFFEYFPRALSTSFAGPVQYWIAGQSCRHLVLFSNLVWFHLVSVQFLKSLARTVLMPEISRGQKDTDIHKSFIYIQIEGPPERASSLQ